MAVVRLQKLHGVGNDFLVLLDGDGVHPVGAEVARALCDRRTGVGADGFIRAVRGEDHVVMHLVNADGSPAEMSGNGIRCLGLAARRAGWWTAGDLDVLTGAGRRSLVWHDGGSMTVDMGPVKVLGPEGGHGGAWRVDVGNPHLVHLLEGGAGSVAAVDLAALAWADGNVEVVEPGPAAEGAGSVVMRVWERGVGPTMACGTGSCAVAAVAVEAGWAAGPVVTVWNPGGPVVVDLTDLGAVRLTGPAVFVADVEVPTP
jgi:diaminopimelate epimerase